MCRVWSIPAAASCIAARLWIPVGLGDSRIRMYSIAIEDVWAAMTVTDAAG